MADGLLIFLHFIIILLAYSSPFWLDWRLIVLGVVLNWLQIAIFGGCVLSILQFKENRSFHVWYLTQLGFRVNPVKLDRFLRRYMPFIVVATAVLVQVVWKVRPLVNFFND